MTIEFTTALPPPTPEAQIEHDDWVSAIDFCNFDKSAESYIYSILNFNNYLNIGLDIFSLEAMIISFVFGSMMLARNLLSFETFKDTKDPSSDFKFNQKSLLKIAFLLSVLQKIRQFGSGNSRRKQRKYHQNASLLGNQIQTRSSASVFVRLFWLHPQKKQITTLLLPEFYSALVIGVVELPFGILLIFMMKMRLKRICLNLVYHKRRKKK